jgi:hypothetical protein
MLPYPVIKMTGRSICDLFTKVPVPQRCVGQIEAQLDDILDATWLTSGPIPTLDSQALGESVHQIKG